MHTYVDQITVYFLIQDLNLSTFVCCSENKIIVYFKFSSYANGRPIELHINLNFHFSKIINK